MLEIKRYEFDKPVKIAQISDLHWRGHQRHEEYVQVFSELYEQLKKEEVNAIVCTGDIFHTKTQNITPEVIDKLVWMFRNLAAIAPLHMILGNHDGNLANEDRQDAISPIINAMQENTEIHLYKKSGVYPFTIKTNSQNLEQVGWFYVYSLFDKEGWGFAKKEQEKNMWDIALFHGSISGCETDSDFKLTDCDLNVGFFENYDLAMLGDIHKQQFLGYRTITGSFKGWIGYPGSLIQQDFGERESKGWFLWTLKNDKHWDVDFVEVKNNMPFITVEWQGTVDKTIEFILTERENHVSGYRIRIVSKEYITKPETIQLQKLLKETYGVHEVAFKQDKLENIETVQTNTVTVSKHSLRNDIVALKKLFKEYLDLNKEKHPLSEDQITKAEETISSYITQIKNSSDEETIRDVIWNIKGLEFNNLYRYGEGNKINFQNFSGLVGIFGPNRLGKSSIVGSLMYCLFNTTDRESIKSAHIINKKKKEGSAKALINVNGTDYLISRKTVKANSKKKSVEEEDKALTSLELYRLSLDGNIIELNNENDIKRSDTDKIVRKLIGTSDDFLTTAFSNQGGINRFIQAGATTRKEILNRFLDLDIFKKLFTLANDDYKKIEAKTSGYDLATWETTMFDLKAETVETNKSIANIKVELSNLRDKVEVGKIWLHDNEAVILNEQKIISLQNEIDSLVASYQKNEKSLEQSEIAYKLASEKIEELTHHVASRGYDIETLKNSIQKLKEAKQKLSEMIQKKNIETTKIEQMKKSIKKLSVVPCGDSFPNCHYIKDSHIDKANLQENELLLQQLNDKISSGTVVIEKFEEKRHEKILEEIENNNKELEKLRMRKDFLEKEITLLHETMSRTLNEISIKKNKLKEVQDRFDSSSKTNVSERRQEITMLQKEVLVKEQELNQKMMKIGMNNAKIEQMENNKQEAKLLLSQLKIYGSIVDAFSKNGLPALVLKTQLPAINLELEKILSGIVDFKIYLETELNSVNTLDVYIEDKHSKRLIELASGMERTIASFALRVALINLSSLPKPDIFICDEGFEYLDADGLNKCMDLLTAIKDRFKAVFIISHIPEIKEIADKIIEIKDLDGESFVQV